MNYSWTKTSVQEQFAWNLSFCLTKIWILPTLQLGWSGRPKHQLMLDFIFPPNLSELPFLVIPMVWYQGTVSGVFPDLKLNWDSQQGRARTTSILLVAFWNFKLKVLKYSRNCISQYILVAKVWHPLIYMHLIWIWCDILQPAPSINIRWFRIFLDFQVSRYCEVYSFWGIWGP